MFRLLIFGLLLACASGRSTAAQTENVKDAINIIVMFCVAGGEKLEVSSRGRTDGGLTLRSGGADVSISKSEAKGLVEGIRQEMSNVSAGQASEARKCMQPYIDRILNVLLGTSHPIPRDRDLGIEGGFGEIFIEWPASSAPCRVDYHIDIAGQRIVPQGSYYHVQNIRLGPTTWTIQGTVNCADGSFCVSPGTLQSGSVSIRPGAAYRFFWNIIPGSLRGGECQFALIG
jgi:hypothetical protein